MNKIKQHSLAIMVVLLAILGFLLILFFALDMVMKFFILFRVIKYLLFADLFGMIYFVSHSEKMKKCVKYFAVISCIVLLPVCFYTLNPLRYSENEIKDFMMKATPVNSDMKTVIELIEKRNWAIRYISEEYGYTDRDRDVEVGEKSIRAWIGDYRNLFITDVTVFWGFDEESKLIDIRVWKDTDSL